MTLNYDLAQIFITDMLLLQDQPLQVHDDKINIQLVCVTGSDNSVHSNSKHKNKSVSLTYSFLSTLVTYSTFL